jgi:hypothetical protein
LEPPDGTLADFDWITNRKSRNTATHGRDARDTGAWLAECVTHPIRCLSENLVCWLEAEKLESPQEDYDLLAGPISQATELIMPAKAKKKSLFKMTPSERNADVRKFDDGLSLDELRPMSAKNKLLWEAAKRRRPRSGPRAVKVLVALDPALLEKVDTYAKDHQLRLSQLISRALENEIRRAS